MIAGWILSCLISGWSCYRWGLRSQRETAKHESKVAALSVIGQVRLDILASRYLPELVGPSQQRLKTPIFNFSARLKAKGRDRIEAAWQAYQKIGDYDVHPDNPQFRDAPAAEKSRPLLLEPLSKLRNEIDAA